MTLLRYLKYCCKNCNGLRNSYELCDSKIAYIKVCKNK